MRKVIGIGETILDIIFRDGQPSAAVPGGSVFNSIVSLSRLGIPVSFVSEVGEDRVGELILDYMKQNDIPTEHIDRFYNGKSPVSLAFLNQHSDAEYTFYKNYPPNRLSIELPQVNPDDIVLIGSYYSVNPDLREKHLELLDQARKKKAIVLYDPNFRKPHKNDAIKLASNVYENLEYATIVRGSAEDFDSLFDLKGALNAYNKVKYYCPHFIFTDGAAGVNLYTKSINKHYDTETTEPVSTIGAGDNFNAGIVYGLLKNEVLYDDLPALSEKVWDDIIRYSIRFACEVCRGFNNSLPKEFAENIKLSK